MKIKNNEKNYVYIQIKYGNTFKYELPGSYEQFIDDFNNKGYSLLKGELSYLNSLSQKIIIKSRNDYISLIRKVQKSKSILKLIYEKELIDSFIEDLDFINIKNVYSDLNTDESILEVSQISNNNNLNIINESLDKEYYLNGINIILDLFKKKYFSELIIKLKREKYTQKKFQQIPKNKLSSSIKLEYNIPSIDDLVEKAKVSFFKNGEKNINNLYNHFEKFEDIRNNNSIYKTMLFNNSKLSILRKVVNDDNKSKVYGKQVIQNNFLYECNHCHINPIKNERYKCTKCLNYNLCETCEENNYENSFHPHTEFILIRINDNNNYENSYSYQCLTKNLVFNFNKDNIVDDEIIIKNILLKNNFILPWPGKDNAYIKCDKSLSSIFCEKINLPKLSLGNSVNTNLVFKKVNKIPKGKYKCICNFFVNNIKYGKPLELEINVI